MTTLIYTAFATYKDNDAIDVSRDGNEALQRAGVKLPIGLVFAPSWKLLKPFLDARKGEGLSPEQWANYVLAYKSEMRASYKDHKKQWEEVLSRKQVTLTCFCKRPEQCHRTTLAKELLTKLGAIYCGEWQGVLL